MLSSRAKAGSRMFEAHAGVGGVALPVDALLGRVAGLRPRGDLRVPARGPRPASACAGSGPAASGRSDLLWLGHVEPAAVPGRKHQLDALGQAARLGQRKSPGKKRRRHGCSDCCRLRSDARPSGSADDPREPAPGCVQSTAVRHGSSGSTNRGCRCRAARIRSRRVGRPGRAGCGGRLLARSGLGCSSMQITG